MAYQKLEYNSDIKLSGKITLLDADKKDFPLFILDMNTGEIQSFNKQIKGKLKIHKNDKRGIILKGSVVFLANDIVTLKIILVESSREGMLARGRLYFQGKFYRNLYVKSINK